MSARRDTETVEHNDFFPQSSTSLCAFLVKAIAKSAVPTKSGTDARKPQCNVNNYFYAGPNTKKIEQQLAEIREEIRALKENRTGGGGSSGKGISLNIPLFTVL